MLQDRIEKNYVTEAKAKNAFAVSTLRMLRAALKNEEIERRGKLDDEAVVGVVSREVKKIKDSIDSFRKGGRGDLAEKAEKEISILGAYLPEQLDDDSIRELVRSAIGELGEVTVQDFGKVMSAVMKDAKGKADGSRVSAIVKEKLALQESD